MFAGLIISITLDFQILRDQVLVIFKLLFSNKSWKVFLICRLMISLPKTQNIFTDFGLHSPIKIEIVILKLSLAPK